MGISESEALEIARKAAELALAGRPVPSTVTRKQAAEMLGVSERTIQRMNPDYAAGNKIPYSWVAARLASR